MLSPVGQQALFTLPALRGLGEVERRQVAELVEEIALQKDDVVYRAGDVADALYVVAAGAVDVLDGADAIARYGPGEVFGESVFAGEPRAVTTRVALDARLLVLSREGLARLLEIHPSLHEHVAAALMRRLKDAVRVMLRAPNAPTSEVVAIEGWSSDAARADFALALAGALERELGREVAIVTITSRSHRSDAPTRPDRPDGVVVGEVAEGGALRERIASELAGLAGRVPVVLAAVDESLAELAPEVSRLADAVVARSGGARSPTVDGASARRRVALVHDRRDGAGPALSAIGIVSLPVDDVGRDRALGRLARHLTHRSVGVALGSGAAWGLAHIGVLDVFEREGVPIDVLAGASMGAIVGAHYALGFSPAELEDIATRVRDIPGVMRILPRLLYLAVDFNVSRPGLFAGEHFQRVLESLAPIRGHTFADLAIPFRATATDIETGARVELGDGDLSDAMRASFSAPWVFSPFRIGERVLIDGGMSDPVPAQTVRAMGADLVIGVNAVPPVYPSAQNPLEAALRALGRMNPVAARNGARLPNSFDVVVRTLQIMQHELGNVRAAEADLLIHPDLRDYWVLEFWRAAEMIEQGRRAAEAKLPEIRAKLTALRGKVSR
ncbi:MAG TPA: patatin-like phospholipase family protein [Candidatus Binatia bacterium]|nr:patatin-like phospholipase family protein [Candidatus Binatia bacterium]